MTTRMPSFIVKPRCPSREQLGRGKSSSNFSTSPISNIKSAISVGPAPNLSYTRIYKPGAVAGGFLTIPRIPLRAPGSVSFAKKLTGNIPGSKRSMPLGTTINDPSGKSVLQKKPLKKSKPTAAGEKEHSKKFAESSKPSSTDRKAKKAQQDLQSPNCISMHGEGPLDMPAETFDIYSIVAMNRVWNEKVAERDDGGSIASNDVCPWKYSHRRRQGLVQKESEIWGSMRTSTPETDMESPPPSLTSVQCTDDEHKKQTTKKLQKKGARVELQRDENNNIGSGSRVVTFAQDGHTKVHKETEEMIIVDREREAETESIYISEAPNSEMEEAPAANEEEITECLVNYDTVNDQNSFSTSKNENEMKVVTRMSLGAPLGSSNIPNECGSPVGILISGEEPMQHETLEINSCHWGDDGKTGASHEKNVVSSVGDEENDGYKEKMRLFAESVSPMARLTQLGSNQVSHERMESSFPSSSITQLSPNTESCETEIWLENDHFSKPKKDDTNAVHVSTKSSYTLAVGEAEHFNADDAALVEPPPQQSPPKVDSQQTQTQGPACVDAETEVEREGGDEIREKMMNLVMTVNTGVDILPDQGSIRKPRGILKGWPPESGKTEDWRRSECQLAIPEDILRKRAILQRVKYPQTFSKVGADYSFPVDISVGDIVESISQSWASICKQREYGACENTAAPCCSTTTSNDDDERNFIGAAYDIVNSGWKYASDLIGVENELEPREDTIRYNGYSIRICGKRLLLESLHVNCDFGLSQQSSSCQLNTSITSLNSLLDSQTELNASRDVGRRRVRLVVRVTENTDREEESIEHNHKIECAEGKWTFICVNGENSDNFVEIYCPIGVHPENLNYGLLNSLLLVDAP